MAKVIFVLDAMPINCSMCPIVQCNKEVFRPTLAGRPSDCPLKEMPEYKDEYYHLGMCNYDDGVADGWNRCLDEIGGGDE